MMEPAREPVNNFVSLEPTPSAVEPGVPRSEVNQNQLWWQISALVVVSTLAVVVGSSFDKQLARIMPESRLLASTYNEKSSGLEAVSRLTRKLGKDVRTWEKPYRQLSALSGTLVVIAPVESLKEFEIAQILEWVKVGNHLVYFDDFTYATFRGVPKKLNIEVEIAKAVDGKVFRIADSGSTNNSGNRKGKLSDAPELAHVQQLKLTAGSRLTGGEPIAFDRLGSVITVIPCGKGKILMGSDPGFLSNGSISKKDYWGNFQFFENWLSDKGRTVIFDERAHGYFGGTSVFVYIAHSPFGLMILQLSIILAIGFLSEWQRFGSAISLDRSRKISNLEFINGLSNAYRRARANPAVLEILVRAFKNKLARALAISPRDPQEKLVEAWSDSKYGEKTDLEGLFAKYDVCMKEREVSDAQMKKIISSCDDIINETQGRAPFRST